MCQGRFVDLPAKSALKRIGKALAAGTETGEELDQLDVLLAWCDDVQARAAEQLRESLTAFDHRAGGGLAVRGRAKTLITLREKLVRMGGHQLPVVRDLAGLRIVADLTLDEQDRLLPLACAALGVAEDERKVIDRRASPVRGYRALHAEFPLEGIRVELQIRTLLQHQWAEVYERMGDRFGRLIRYDDPPEDGAAPLPELAVEFVDLMQRASLVIAAIEDARQESLKTDELVAEVRMRGGSLPDATLAGVEARRHELTRTSQELSSSLELLGNLLDQWEPEGA